MMERHIPSPKYLEKIPPKPRPRFSKGSSPALIWDGVRYREIANHREAGWHRYFALFPKKTRDRGLVWLDYIWELRDERWGGGVTGGYYTVVLRRYSEVPDPNSGPRNELAPVKKKSRRLASNVIVGPWPKSGA